MCVCVTIMRSVSNNRSLSFLLPPTAFSAVKYAPLGEQVGVQVGVNDAPETSYASKSVDALANESQIDRNLSLVNLARAFIAAFGITTVLGAVASEEGARARLQCTLSAASCLVTSMYYSRMTAVRMSPGRGYSRQGNASVDSMRFSNWAVCNALQAWLALVVRGPFENDKPFLNHTYDEWFRLGTFLCSIGVILGGAALFCVESARIREQSTRGRVAWGALGVTALVGAITCAIITSLAFHQPADRNKREEHEISIGFAISSFWIFYPIMGCIRVTLSAVVQHDATEALKKELKEMGLKNAESVLGFLRGFRGAVVWGFRAANASHDYHLIEMDPRFGVPLVPPLYMQILDTVLAVADVVVIAMPALAVTTLAFSIED